MKTKVLWLAALVLLGMLVISGTAFAEGEVPPAAPEEPAEIAEALPPAEAAPPEDVAAPAETVAVDTPVEPAPEAPVADAVAIEPIAVELQSAPAEAAAPVLEPLLVDASGEPLVLATEASAELLQNSDPYFNVGVVKYCFVPDAGTCDGSCGVCTKQNDPIQTAIDYIHGNGIIPTDGKIYVEADTYNYPVIVDGTLANLANLKGLIGLPDSGYTFPTINGNVTVSNTVSGFTLSGFVINGEVYFPNNTGALLLKDLEVKNSAANGIRVADHIGSITLNGIISNANDYNGLEITSTGNVSVSDSVFNENTRSGILLTVIGTTTLNNVVAMGNDQYGVLAENTSSMTIKNVIANSNALGGIYIETLGAVNVINSNASGDRGPINFQGGDGLHIETIGAVNINGMGAFGNDENGVYIRTKGAITITGIYAGNNGFSGVDLDNCLYNGSVCLGIGGITVRNASGSLNDLTNNNHFGLWAASKGSITITNLRANSNGSDGTFLWNDRGGSSAAISVATSGAVRNEFNANGWNLSFDEWYPSGGVEYWVRFVGLTTMSRGTISIKNSSACDNINDNGWGGGILAFNSDAAAPKTVIITDSEISRNDSGVYVLSKGGITLTNVNASSNRGFGINLDNCLYNDGTDLCAGVGSVRLTNIDAHENSGLGIEVNSKGLITLLGVNAGNNSDMGISLRNNFSGTTAGMVLTNINANDNNNTGLSISTNGSAILANINTHNNAKRYGGISDGEMVQDFFNQMYGPDTWWFDADSGPTYEFRLDADVSWSLNRIEFTPYIELYDPEVHSGPVGIGICDDTVCTLSFINLYGETHSFYVRVGSTNGDGFNGNDGFYRLSLGDSDTPNQQYWASGTSISAGGSITVRGINSSNNSLIGLGASAMGNGNITLSNMGIYSNGTEGVYLTCGQNPADFNDSGFGTGTIAISGSNSINDNGWDGLIMATSGNITIGNLEASYNGQETEIESDGVSTRDDHAAKVVTLSNMNIGQNGWWGLSIYATGNISLANTDVWNNLDGGGINLDNCLDTGSGSCTGTGTIRLANVSSSNNQGEGISAFSKGLITLSGVQANGNWQTGIWLQNDYNGATAGITLGAVGADSNGNTGITAWTNGALLMSGINASNNALVWGGTDNGSTLQEFFNQGRGPDHWWFDAEAGVPITLKLWADGWSDYGADWLNPFDFHPLMKVYDDKGIEITSNQTISSQYSNPDMHNNFYQIVWTPTSDGSYYLEVGSTINLGTDFDGNSGFYRLSIDDPDPSDPDLFWVDGLSYDAGGNVALSGTNSFTNNEQAGLIGWNGGNVTFANVFNFNNGSEGIFVDNTAGSGNVTLLGTNASVSNGWEGLRITTNGAVSISNLETNNNGLDGVRIEANTDLKAVTLTNVVTMWNGRHGINLLTHGFTTLNKVRAWFNGYSGAVTETNGYTLSVLNSSFMCNEHYGLGYVDLGLVTLIDINNIYLGNGNVGLQADPY